MPYFIGQAMLLAATFLFKFAKTPWLLVVSRLLQGLVAGVVYAIGLAILVETVGRALVHQQMSIALTCSRLGLTISPVIGGLIYHEAGYIKLFYMALGLTTVDIGLRMLVIGKPTAAKHIPSGSHGTPAKAYGTFFANENPNRNSINQGLGISVSSAKNGNVHETSPLLNNPKQRTTA